MTAPDSDKAPETQAKNTSTDKKTLDELLSEVRPAELANAIKKAVKKSLKDEKEGYPKLSRE